MSLPCVALLLGAVTWIKSALSDPEYQKQHSLARRKERVERFLERQCRHEAFTEDEECPICFEAFADLQIGDTVTFPCCNYGFCMKCATTHLTRSEECPCCRRDVLSWPSAPPRNKLTTV